MKAIYINLDPYLAAFAAWIAGGKVGPAPSFDPIPLAVTIPLGETAAIFAVGDTTGQGAGFLVDGVDLYANAAAQGNPPEPSIGESVLQADYAAGLSAFPAGTTVDSQLYQIFTVSGETANQTVIIVDAQEDDVLATIPFTVLVRREQASGPVDLVDFVPPAAAPSAADIKSALVAAGDGALAGVRLGGAILLAPPSTQTPTDATMVDNGDSHALEYLDPGDALKVLGSTSNS